MSYTVGEMAKYAGITARTLHHYDQIGLLSPSTRTEAGYRLYDDSDVDRLQQILFYRELDFALEDIAAILNDPEVDPGDHLRRQRDLLTDRIERLHVLVAAIDRTMEANRMGYQLSARERLEIFGEWTPPPSYAADLSKRRGRGPFAELNPTLPDTKEGWQQLEDHRRAVVARLQAVMDARLAPGSVEAMDAVESYRTGPGTQGLSHEQLELIAGWYADQPEYFGFVARPDEQRPGMAAYFRDAVQANRKRASTE